MVRLLQTRKKPINLVLIFAIVAFSLHFLTLLFFILQGIKIRKLSQRKPSNFVQLIEGRQMASKDNLARDPEAIKNFISKTMILMFNWSGTLPSQTIEEINKPTLDLGIPIKTLQGRVNKVSTSSWMASFAFSEDFRKGFLSEIAIITPPEVFMTSSSQAISAQLMIKQIDSPEKIAQGKWRVGLVADLIQIKRGNGRKLITPFNKDILVRATDFFSYPIPNFTSDLQSAIYGIRSSKLEIYEIRNLCLLNNPNNLKIDRSPLCNTSENPNTFIN
jgi:hypothetical protein